MEDEETIPDDVFRFADTLADIFEGVRGSSDWTNIASSALDLSPESATHILYMIANVAHETLMDTVSPPEVIIATYFMLGLAAGARKDEWSF